MTNRARLATFLLVFLSLLPGAFVRETVNVSHFFSSHHIFEYASKHNFQYGIDIIDNVGPFGYLHYPYTYAGGVFWAKMFWFVLISSAYACYATLLAGGIRSWFERLLFLLPVAYFPLQIAFPWFSFEVIPRLAVLFSALYLLSRPGKNGRGHEKAHVIFCGLFYSLLTLEKASNVYYLFLLILVLSLYWLLQKQFRSIFWLVGSYLSGVSLFWVLAGQNLLNLPIYFRSMSLFISAYQDALVQDMTTRGLLYGLLYCGAASVLIVLRTGASVASRRSRTLLPREVFRSVLVGALFFLIWKHGMMRSVSSYGTFLYTVPILFAFLCLYPIATQEEGSNDGAFAKWVLLPSRTSTICRGIVLVSLLMAVMSNVVSYQHEFGPRYGFFQEVIARLSLLAHYRPGQVWNHLDTQLEQLKTANALTATLRTSIASSRVDEFGSSPEILLLNGLNYRPRPVPIDFVVVNSELKEKNGHYYQNPETAPDFLFVPDFGLRLADSSAYLSVLFNYQAVDTFKEELVMKKRIPWQRIERRTLSSGNRARFGEWVSLTDRENLFLWIEIDIKPSLLGRVKNFFYKRDLVRLDVLLEDGTTQSFHVSPSALRSGFLINPVIRTKSSLLWSGRDKSEPPWVPAKAYRVALDSPVKSRFFASTFETSLSVIATAFPSDASSVSVDLHRGMLSIGLMDNLNFATVTKFPIDMLSRQSRDDVFVEGLSTLESNDKESWRWAEGPTTRVKFYVDHARIEQGPQLLLGFAFKNGVPIPDQTVTIRFNGKDLRRFSSEEIGIQKQIDVELPLAVIEGVNLLEIAYRDWNHGKRVYNLDESRRLAVVVMRLALHESGRTGVSAALNAPIQVAAKQLARAEAK